MVVPSSNIILIETPIDIDNKNNITFTSVQAQLSYFNGLPHTEITDATYQRKEGVIRYPALVDNIMHYNYCMYQNENFSNKWFFAFITNMEYVNNNVTNITIETDVWQTYQFDITLKNSFVEREHVNNDSVGLHTLPEGLETGEFICNSHVIDDHLDNITSELVYILSCSVDLGAFIDDPTSYDSEHPIPPSPIRRYNGIISGTSYYPALTPRNIKQMLEGLTLCGQIDAVNGLFMAPADCVGTLQADYSIEETTSANSYTNSISKQTTINGYTPKNNKLLCYPFNYLLVSNNNGTSVPMKYEDFSTSACGFSIKMAVCPGASIRMIPTNYKGIAENDEEGINMGKLPICSYPVDMYTNWLTQNSINVGGVTITSDDINMATAGTNAIAGTLANALTGNVGGTITSATNGASGIFNSLIAKKQHELIPPQVRGNLNCGDVITSSGKNAFHFYKMSIKQEYAKCIDDYFSMYGYLVNSVKTPNITGRRNWNYIKTIDVNLIGNIIQEDIEKIKSLFNNGITLWHNPSTFLDYSQNNDII